MTDPAPHTNLDLLEQITGGKQIPISEFPRYVENFLAQDSNAQFVTNPNATTSLLYSGSVGDLYSGDLTSGIADRAGGKVGTLDQTDMGKLLGGMFDHNTAGSLESTYGRFLDLEGLEKADIGNEIYGSFRPTSAAFAENIEGRVVTFTPQSNPSAVYGTNEVPKVIDGLGEGVESGRITHINGIEGAEFRSLSDIPDPETRQLAYKEAFDQSFADRMSEVQPDAYRSPPDAEGRFSGVLAPTTEELRMMGAGDDISLRPVSPDATAGMTRIPGAEFADDVASARMDHVTDMIDRGTLPEASRNAANTMLDDYNLRAELPRIIDADAKGELRSFAADPDGHTSHLIDTQNSTIYTVEEGRLTGVQKFDSSQEAGHAFGRMMGEAAETYPGTFKGLPAVHNSLGSLGNHIDDLASPAWRRALSNFGEGAADLAGKGSKILGPLGVAAAGAEVYGLEMKLQDYQEFGLVPEEAMLAYRGILTAHTAQATIDPSLVGGEVAVQLAHDEWAKQYGISPDVTEALEPGSLLEDLNDGRQWLEAQAEAAGEAVADYAVSRWNNPDLIKSDLEAAGDAIVDAGEYVVDTASDAAEAVGDYASTRWDDPSRLLDDAEAVGDAVGGAVSDAGEAIGDAASSAWNWLRGNDEPSALEQSLRGGETEVSVPETVPFGDAVQGFVSDREVLRQIDPQQELIESQLAEFPEAEALFMRLNDDGIVRFPKDATEGASAQERVGKTLDQARTIDRDLSAERTNEADTEATLDASRPNFVEDYDYSSGM